MTHHSIIIIGSGMAAITLVREFRKLDKDTDVLIITADQGDVYSKPMLSNAYAKNKSADDLISAKAEQFAEQQGINIKTNTTVTAINPEAKTLDINNEQLSFDHLVLALGASPFKPPIDGNANEHILTVNTLDDYRVFQEKAASAEHIAIIGPGLIGCEFANDIVLNDKKITIIGPDKWPMSSLLSEPVGRYLQTQLEAIGVNFELTKTVVHAKYNENTFALKLSDDSQMQADLVLSAIGLRANIALAKTAGIECHRGIQTNQYLETNKNGIYALGDCAEVESLVLPFVMPLMNAARALAKTLSKTPTKVNYPAMPVMVKTPACPLVVSPANEEYTLDVETTDQGVKAIHKNANGNIVGFELSGEFTKLKQSLTKELPAVLS